jgi:hypothetical protein
MPNLTESVMTNNYNDNDDDGKGDSIQIEDFLRINGKT